jgi:hypothetical protein
LPEEVARDERGYVLTGDRVKAKRWSGVLPDARGRARLTLIVGPQRT